MSARRGRPKRLGATIALALAGALVCAFAPPPPQTLAEIPQTNFLAEGVAVTPKGALLVSGVRGSTILQLTSRGPQPWLKDQASGGLFGMAVDARRGRLWVAEAGGDKVPGCRRPATSGVLEVQLADGRILARHSAPIDGKRHWIGDLTL